MRFSSNLRRTLTPTSPLRRAAVELRKYGLRFSDYTREELFPVLLATGADLNLDAFDQFIEQPSLPHMWSSEDAADKRQELKKLREYAFDAYAAGKVELALMTGKLMQVEAKHIGMRVVVDPKMRKADAADSSIKTAQQESAKSRTEKTAAKFDKYKDVVSRLIVQYGKAPNYRVAAELGVSEPTLRDWRRNQGISES